MRASQGATRAEYEYPIPAADAREMLDALCIQPVIEKEQGFGRVGLPPDLGQRLRLLQQLGQTPPHFGQNINGRSLIQRLQALEQLVLH